MELEKETVMNWSSATKAAKFKIKQGLDWNPQGKEKQGIQKYPGIRQ